MHQEMKVLAKLVSGLFLATTAVAVHAATPAPNQPDSGRVLDSVQGAGAAPVKKALPTLEVEQTARPAMTAPSGLKIMVSGFRVTGATVFDAKSLESLVASHAGREVPFSDIEHAAALISRHYRQNGFFVARAYVPAQEIKDGIVEIAVLEGKYGGIVPRIDSKSGKMSEDRVKELVSGTVNPGDVINEAELERSLLLLNDLPGIEVRSTLTPGASVGTSDLNLNVKEGEFVTGSVDLDNFGNRYTGTWRLGGTLNLNNPAGLGDQFSARLMTGGSGMKYGRLSYALPVGVEGTRVGVAYSRMDYELGKDFESLNAQGDGDVLSVFAAHPLIRSRNRNLFLSAGFDHKTMQDDANGQTSRDRGVNALTLAANGDQRDGLWGGGVTSASVSWTHGDLDLKSIADKNLDAGSARTDGGYDKFNYRLSRLQSVDDRVNLYVSLSGQLATGNLDSSEKMSVGGASGVRAYPQGEAPADEAHLFTVEGRWDISHLIDPAYGNLQFTAFFDAAHVSLHHTTWAGWQGTNPNTRNAYTLAGAGIGLNLTKSNDYSLRASYAFKVGDNDGADANGNDSDNSDNAGRFWLQAVKWF